MINGSSNVFSETTIVVNHAEVQLEPSVQTKVLKDVLFAHCLLSFHVRELTQVSALFTVA